MSVTPDRLRKYMNLASQAVVPDAQLQVYTDAAALMVLEDLAAAGLSSDRLGLIELNLAAHFALMGLERGGLTGVVVGTSEETYNNKNTGTGFGSTMFGETAIALDTSGVIAKLAASPLKARFEVVGSQGQPFNEAYLDW